MNNTVELAFEEFGTANAPPIIILHGFFASARNWRNVATTLATTNHVYVLDMRNHGTSPHSPIMDYPAMADDLLNFMDTHQLRQATLLGHSMGGKIAMWFALNHPERIHKLIVVDIAPISYPHNFDNLINALQALPLSQISNRKQAELWLTDRIPDLSYRQFLLQNLVLKEGHYGWRINLTIFANTAPHIAAFPDTHNISAFTGMCLFIAGSDSHYLKQKDINQLFPKAILTIINNAGHWIHVQQPTRFMAAIDNFLQQN